MRNVQDIKKDALLATLKMNLIDVLLKWCGSTIYDNELKELLLSALNQCHGGPYGEI